MQFYLINDRVLLFSLLELKSFTLVDVMNEVEGIFKKLFMLIVYFSLKVSHLCFYDKNFYVSLHFQDIFLKMQVLG